ncbi:MAG: hypothetical protein IT365_10535 [Candidatus Hydrogenedentes bacterium]|nr:hypothetical protein [Candidatus Hydrogenedentota bacterium]
MANKAVIPVFFGLLVCFAGCGPKEIPIDEVKHPESLTAATLAATGDMEVALEALYSGQPPADSRLEPARCLLLTESGFVRLSSAERTAMVQENNQVGGAVRELARAGMAKAAEAAAAGRAEEAQQWKDRVATLGAELADPRHTKLMQLVGQAIQKLAASTP